MFKSKLKVWVIALIFFSIILNVSNIKNITLQFFSNFKKPTKIIMLDDFNNSMKHQLSSRFKGIKLKVNSFYEKNIDYMIKYHSNSENEEYLYDDSNENFIKQEKVFYSPIVLLGNKGTNFYVDGDNNIFYQIKDTCIEVNLKQILEGIENDKTWKDISFNEKINNNETIFLYIPKKDTEEYKYVKELIKLTLNDFSYENIDKMETRANNILNKCQEFEKIDVCLKQKFYVLVLVPEYYVRECISLTKTILTPIKTINIYNDLYINKKEIEDFSLEKALKKDKKIQEKTGYRNIYSKYNIRNVNGYMTANDLLTIIEK